MNKNNFFTNLFKYTPSTSQNTFKLDSIPDVISTTDNTTSSTSNSTKLSSTLSSNLNYLKSIYKSLISSDINIKEFKIPIKNKTIDAALFFIDGITNMEHINNFILKPLLLKNSISMTPVQNPIKKQTISESILTVKKFNLENYIYESLIPEANIKKENKFSEIIKFINQGFTLLLIDSLDISFLIETKGINQRSISPPLTEPIIKGAHQGFVENLRTNTSLLRKIINNENLIIENISIGEITKTDISICYMSNITNDSLISEIKNRLNNIAIDYIIYPNNLENLIIDHPSSIFPQTSSSERPDKTAFNILNGKVAILINGIPYAIIVPTLFADFLVAAEDNNLNFFYSNFLKIIRIFSVFFALYLPGLYIAITSFHQELIPTELLFAIINARKLIPFPVIFEILIMEFSFELLGEASVRVSSSFSTTVGIIGALILGDAAVSANIVSPILIIIVAFTGISSFAIPDYNFKYSIRILRFLFIILAFISGFLGIAVGSFILFVYISSLSSFGVNYIFPEVQKQFKEKINYYKKPIWKINKRPYFLNTKKQSIENNTSMKWRNYE